MSVIYFYDMFENVLLGIFWDNVCVPRGFHQAAKDGLCAISPPTCIQLTVCVQYICTTPASRHASQQIIVWSFSHIRFWDDIGQQSNDKSIYSDSETHRTVWTENWAQTCNCTLTSELTLTAAVHLLRLEMWKWTSRKRCKKMKMDY